MRPRAAIPAILLASLLLAPAAAAETIYKYRGADGRTTYSNRLITGAELIEAFEYKFTAPAEPRAKGRKAENSDAAVDARIKKQLAAFELAWTEVQDATQALAVAEARLKAGAGPQDGEGTSLGGPAVTAPAGIGGPQALASPAAGGPVGVRRGGGRNAEYFERLAGLESDVKTARSRLDAALSRYNQLR